EPNGKLPGQFTCGELLRQRGKPNSSISGVFQSGCRSARPVWLLEGYYNRQRVHSAIDYITPDRAEAMSAAPGARFPVGSSPQASKGFVLHPPRRMDVLSMERNEMTERVPLPKLSDRTRLRGAASG